jgi:hypothetical protein
MELGHGERQQEARTRLGDGMWSSRRREPAHGEEDKRKREGANSAEEKQGAWGNERL